MLKLGGLCDVLFEKEAGMNPYRKAVSALAGATEGVGERLGGRWARPDRVGAVQRFTSKLSAKGVPGHALQQHAVSNVMAEHAKITERGARKASMGAIEAQKAKRAASMEAFNAGGGSKGVTRGSSRFKGQTATSVE